MKKSKIKTGMAILCIFIMIMIGKQVKAESISTTSSLELKEGETKTIQIKGNKVTGNLTAKSSDSSIASVSLGSQGWIEDNTITATITAKREGNVTIKIYSTKSGGASSVVSSVTAEDVDVSTTCTVKVTSKQEIAPEVPSNVNKENETKGGTVSEGGNNNGTSNAEKTNTGTSASTTSKTSGDSTKTVTKAHETKKVEETKEKEEATPQFGLNSLILKGIKVLGEEVEIGYSPTFGISTYEYNVEVENDVKEINAILDAGIYQENVKVEKPEELKVGENTITIKMQKEGQNDVIYTIKVNKKEQETVETSAEVEEKEEKRKEKKEFMIEMPIMYFILLQAAIIIIEVVLIKYVPWNKIKK